MKADDCTTVSDSPLKTRDEMVWKLKVQAEEFAYLKEKNSEILDN